MSELVSLHHHVLRHASETPDAPAIATPTIRLNYAQLARRMLEFAATLRAQGLSAGDRIVVSLPNSAAAVVASLAVQALGGTAVEVNRGWGVGPLRDVVARTKPRQVVTFGRDARIWGEALEGTAIEHVWVVHRELPSPPLLDALRRPAGWLREDATLSTEATGLSVTELPTIDPDGVALILFTSGSTGAPQGVLQTHRNIDANSRSIVGYLDLTARDRVLATLPLYYCYGRSLLQTHLVVGGSVYFDDRFAFPRIVMEALAAEGCTGFAGVPLTFEILRRSVDMSSIPMPALRYVTQAGGAMAPDTIRWVREAFTPVPLYVMYGQTEATARITYLPPDRAVDKEGSIGIPISGMEVRVLGQDGTARRPGELGEIVVRGDSVTPGYLDDPEATAEILRDGWLWTGDLAVQDDDGYLFHRGRAREMIKVGGRRVSPVEIEQAIERHPDVVEAAVRGIPDSLKGETPAAYVVRRHGSELVEDDIRAFLRSEVPAWLLPSRITFLDRLPRNEAGKLLRSELPLTDLAR
jgi:acyl-coenzyme A synthetase/AMP-(fatty) acid ligase